MVDAAYWFISSSKLISLVVSAFVDDSGDFNFSVAEVNSSHPSSWVTFFCSLDR